MIEVRNLHLPLDGGKPSGCAYNAEVLHDIVARKLGCRPDDFESCFLARRSVDARKKNDVHFVATARVSLRSVPASCESQFVASLCNSDVVVAKSLEYTLPRYAGSRSVERPVVIGAGAAGLFAAVALAEAGLKPILIERGDPTDVRALKVEHFNKTGELDPSSNIQFGAGGAGTFSDGKLTTGTNVAENAWVLNAFVEAGAASDILWSATPHIGSDVLPTVVNNLVSRIERAGGEVRWRTRLYELVVQNGSLAGVRVSKDTAEGERCEEIPCTHAILATGHSARDVFESLKLSGFTLEPKVFSMGVRIEHPQAMVNESQYGRAAKHPALGAANYKLSCHLPDGRGVYTFCMCPGGTVVAAASEEGGVVTNGMSEFARDGVNANAALLVNVYPQDIPDIEKNVLAGVELQRSCESAAYVAGGGTYAAPAQLLGDFMRRSPSSSFGEVLPTYPRGVALGSLDGVLPSYLLESMRAGIPMLAKRLRGFDRPDAVLTGVESRSSSPVRIKRGDTCESVDVAGLYPCGEGAGYAGGIMSAAADGLRCAAALVESLNGGR